MEFSTKYRTAIIFLSIVLGLAGILALIYFALKKDLCNCYGDKKKEDEEANIEEDEEKEQEEGVEERDVSLELEEFERTERELHEGNNDIHEEYIEEIPPEIVVTEAEFKPQKSKKSAMKSIMKKLAKPIAKVRFGSVTASASQEGHALVNHDGVGSINYGTGDYLESIPRSDSMDSFVSSVSVVSENIEEFGDEVSPGRLQIVLDYQKRSWTLVIGVKQAECLIHTGKEKMYWQVHAAVLPFKRNRFKTKYKASSTPVFNQSFEVDNVAEQALSQMSVRFRVYGKVGRTGKKKMAGEAELQCSVLQNRSDKLMEWQVLKRKRMEANPQVV